MNRKLIEAAQILEAERARPMPSTQNADDRLLDLFLSNVKGDGTAERVRAERAMKRIVATLRQGGGSFTGLLVRLLNAEHSSRGGR